jgi:hypothetical protein
MLPEEVKPGQKFEWQVLEEPTSSGVASVQRVRTDRQEGMGPETEIYVALWIEALGLSGSLSGESFFVTLGVDGNCYLDGRRLSIRLL